MVNVDFRANATHSFPEGNHVSKTSSLAICFVIGNKGDSFDASLYYFQHLVDEQGRDGVATIGNKQTVGILNDGLARGKKEVINDRNRHVDTLSVVSYFLARTYGRMSGCNFGIGWVRHQVQNSWRS